MAKVPPPIRSRSASAIILDLGGVVLESPLRAIATYETAAGLPRGGIAQLVAAGGPDGPWAQLERGELSAHEFAGEFTDQAAQAGYVVDSTQLLDRIEYATTIRPAMLTAVQLLRENGHLVAALTNAWDMPGRAWRIDQLRPLFTCFVESFRIGMRKPEPRIYRHICNELGITPSTAVFLDDIGTNLKPARAAGMRTIKVSDPVTALAELEQVVGFCLTPASTRLTS
ncbi:MAG: HAD family phosphatase [Acidobacteriota bacterium]|nr:HAD family phosphatase [Acidobacteriota bacterium]